MAPSEIYRRTIDRLVHACRDGQGQIGSDRVRAGVWHKYADAARMPDQWAINELLARLSEHDRDILAEMLADEFRNGVHETLVVLHEQKIVPFEDGYEGTPFHDFIGRLNDWDWPERTTAHKSSEEIVS
jgi:hypothetical protein